MLDKKQLLKTAFLKAAEILPPAALKDEIEESVLATEMKAFAQKNDVEFTDEEISEAIAEGLAALKNANDYGKPIGEAKPSTLAELFLKAAELFPPAVIDDDIEPKLFAERIKALAAEENLEFTDEEIAKAIADGLKKLKKVSSDFDNKSYYA